MGSKNQKPLEKNVQTSNPTNIPCLSYAQLLLFFPTVIAQIIWSYNGWVVEEIVIAMEEVMSIPSWNSNENNFLTVVGFKFPLRIHSQQKPLQLEIHSFYSTEDRCGGDVYISRRYCEDKREWLKKTAQRVVQSKNQQLVISFFHEYFMTFTWNTPQKITLRNERNLRHVQVLLDDTYDAILDLGEIFVSPLSTMKQ